MSASSMFRKSGGISAAIIICRVLGLLREVLLAKIFGGGMLMTAWGLAFMAPNLFRRLFGEGAVGTSIVPIISYSMEKDGQEAVRRKLGAIFLSLTSLLLALCILFSALALLLSPFASADRVRIALELMPLLLPYALFICLIGAFSSALKCAGKFFLPALGTLSLNIAMVVCLIFVCPLFSDKLSMLKSLSLAVVLSGMIQLAFTAVLLKGAGIFPDLRISQFWREPVVAELWRLTLPGMIGASALQISFVVDRSMACWLGDYAVPALNFSDRIIDLPIGIFGVAMASVVAPALARSAAKEEHDAHRGHFLSSLSAMLFLSIPAAAFIFTCRTPLVRLFYMRGAFGERELAETVRAMTFYSAGIPFFCCVKIIASAFHSRKDMKTPVKISLSCIVLNIALNWLLMFKLQQGGIALATAVSSLVNCLALLAMLKRRDSSLAFSKTFLDLLRFSLAAAAASGVSAMSYQTLHACLRIPLSHVPADLLPIAASAAAFTAVFLLLSHLLGSEIPSGILRPMMKGRKT